MRWFPDLDENGNPVPWTPEPPEEVEQEPNAAGNPTVPGSGYWYVLHRGNTLQDVADAVIASRQLNVTVEEIQSANPSSHPNRLKAGQKIFVPAPEGSVIPSPGPLTFPPPDKDSPPEIPAPNDEGGMATDPVPNDDNQVYIVRPGDSLFSIAHDFGCTVSELRALNPELGGFSPLKIGQKLRKP
jgi:LysM repeat protein